MKHWEVWEIKLLCVETDKMSCTMGSISTLLSLEWWWWWGWQWLRLDFLRKDERQEHLDRKDLTALVVSMKQGYMFCFQFEAFTSCALTSLTPLDFGVLGERPGWIQSWKHWFRQIAQIGTFRQSFKVTDNLCYPRMVSKNMVKRQESHQWGNKISRKRSVPVLWAPDPATTLFTRAAGLGRHWGKG